MKNHTDVQFDSPGRRAAAYWHADGLPEVAFGLVMLLWGILGMAWEELHWRNWWMRTGAISAGPLLLALFFAHRRILDSLKARVTYPRTGYARPPADLPVKINPSDEILTLGLAHPVDENVSSFRGTVLLFVFGFSLLSFFRAPWILPLVMTAIAAGICFWSRDDVHPYSWRAVLPIVLAGFAAAGLELEPMTRQCMPLVIGGAWLLAMGTRTLIRYLRAHSKPDAGQEGFP